MSAFQVQQEACGELEDLALRDANQVLIAKAGDISTIVNGMKVHRRYAGVQERGCAALLILADDNDANQVLIANAGGIIAIVSGMEAHLDHTGVQEQGCGALRNLATNDDNEVLIVEAGGMPSF